MRPSASATAATRRRRRRRDVAARRAPQVARARPGRGSATVAPRSRSRAAVAAPMPLAPPVTTAVSPSNSLMPCSSTSRIDVDLRAVPQAGSTLAGQHGRRRRPGRPWRRPAGAGRPRRTAYSSMVPARPPRARSRMPTAVTSLSAMRAGVDEAGLAGEADEDDPPARLDQVDGERGQRGGVGRVDDRVEGQVRQRRRPSRRRRSPASAANSSGSRPARAGAPRRPARAANWAASRPIVPGPRTSSRSPGGSAAARTARSALPPGSTSAPERRVDRVGQARAGRVTGTGSCSASAPGQPPRMPISYRSAQTCCRPRRQRRAAPAAEHGVAGDPAADPGRVDAGADRRDRAAPLVADPHRVARPGRCAGRPSRR